MGNGVSTTGSIRRTAALLLVVCWALLATVSPAGAAERDLVKVFVVADPARTGGQLPTLRSIAAATLDDPGRSGEILALNQGRTQPDGGALTGADDQLHPGWLLRLPPDASGPDVKLAQDNSTAATATAAPATPSAGTGTAVTFPLAAVLAVIGSILLALVTVAIVARRRTARWFAFVGRGRRALGAPARRRKRLTTRQAVGRRFATDDDSVRRAYDTLAAVATPARPVYAMSLDEAGTTVWLSASDTLNAPWQHIDSTRWRHPAGAPGWGNQESPEQARAETSAACLVRTGTDADGGPVFVDLSRLDGVLSVTGDRAVARDVVENLLTEIARIRPNLPVTVLPTADAPLAIPAGLNQVAQVNVPAGRGGNGMRGTVRGAATRRPVGGLVVLAGAPDDRQAAALLALCGSTGGGWTGLVCGPVGAGAHWRWHAGADGTVDIPTLGMDLTVPA